VSVVVVPGQFHSEPHPAGKLANTLLSVAVAGLADPSRFRRGKQYLTDHAVGRLELEAGVLRAVVNGSRATPYQVVVRVPVLPPFDNATSDALRQQLNRLTPEPVDIDASCTCPDPDATCKHAVAALLALAAELVAQPRLLVQWRCTPGDSTRAEVGSRASAPPRLRLVGRDDTPPAPTDEPSRTRQRTGSTAPLPHAGMPPEAAGTPRVSAPPPRSPADPFADPEWVAFLGALPPVDLPTVPHEPARTGRTMAGNVDVGAVMRSAIEALTTHR